MTLPLPLTMDECSQCMAQDKIESLGIEKSRRCSGAQCLFRDPFKEFKLRRIRQPLPTTTIWPAIPDLPNLIDSLRDGQPRPEYFTFSEGMVGYRYTNISGLLRHKPEVVARFRKLKNIPGDITIVIHQESNDNELEKLSKPSEYDSFFRSLESIGKTILMSPGYSIYSNGSMCRYHQLYNLWRSVLFFVRATEYGLPCIPVLGWAESTDLKRISEWLNLQPFITHLAINLQTLHSPDKLQLVIDDIKHLESESREFRWIIFGSLNAKKSFYDNNLGERMHIFTGSHIHGGMAGRSFYKHSTTPRGLHLVEENRNILISHTHSDCKN